MSISVNVIYVACKHGPIELDCNQHRRGVEYEAR